MLNPKRGKDEEKKEGQGEHLGGDMLAGCFVQYLPGFVPAFHAVAECFSRQKCVSYFRAIQKLCQGVGKPSSGNHIFCVLSCHLTG